ncbi:hypothetical protein GUITHDRAFT_154099 [Guillardia theta CCMP2712]|uniref:J domain-containing protein n=1 Tax=Guillardia theta (strain CCMP2712) TaxID=905079 RepID=L1IWC4_GUITC|nr:hypothetical protein GUITHDRAFT_154099 [Guillardia theta CCMP2712]EKX40568.1 hypothetical protein GUITHDRAFT_154099 [Guillardia theta CCMP2712]|eukprot:XP_005827548.1 hypothetical protein GUITHDRAFT_154099 [Guillardia theta CCMP2712]
MTKMQWRFIFWTLAMGACFLDVCAGEHDLYATLGVEKDCSDREIARAYRKLAVMWHPDKNKDPEAKTRFTEIAQAYEILKDPKKRQVYNRSLRGHGREGDAFSDFSSSIFRFEDADSMFRENFGDQVWREWQPGMTLHSTIRRGGRSYSITIYPDGSSEEEEAASDSGASFYMKRSSEQHGDSPCPRLRLPC